MLQRDRVLPISRGPRYTVTNVAYPACRSSNASKCNQEVTSRMRRKDFDEPAFLTAHATVLAGLVAEGPGPASSWGSPPVTTSIH